MKRLSNAFPIVFLTYYYYPRELGCARIIKKRYYYHSRAMFRPFHALVSREFCPNAKSQSTSGCHSDVAAVAASIFFIYYIYLFDSGGVKRFLGCVANFILVDVICRSKISDLGLTTLLVTFFKFL